MLTVRRVVARRGSEYRFLRDNDLEEGRRTPVAWFAGLLGAGAVLYVGDAVVTVLAATRGFEEANLLWVWLWRVSPWLAAAVRLAHLALIAALAWWVRDRILAYMVLLALVTASTSALIQWLYVALVSRGIA